MEIELHAPLSAALDLEQAVGDVAAPTASAPATGSPVVRRFYDRVGWSTDVEGVPEDTRRFGARRVGAIQRMAHRVRVARIRRALNAAPHPLTVIECGCGGNPARFLAEDCMGYTGVDFSQKGLELAAQRLSRQPQAPDVPPARLVRADLTSLPFHDGTFSAAYSAHAIYHIPSAAGQARALDEIMRVLKPGGVAVLVLANPRPLLSPIRLLKRLAADAPLLSAIAGRLRSTPPLPYKPMTIRWMRRQLARHGRVKVTVYAIASMWFNQRVSEQRRAGRMAWKLVAWLERRLPGLSARLGNYVTIIVRKHPNR